MEPKTMTDDDNPTHTFEEDAEQEDRNDRDDEEQTRRSWVEGAGTG